MPDDRRTWRPQSFGTRNSHHIRDPLIEPLWEGIRVLAHIERGEVELIDTVGDLLDPSEPRIEALVRELRAAGRADRLVLDGYVTEMATRSTVGAVVGDVSAPTMVEMGAQILLGRRPRPTDAGPSAEPDAVGDGPVAFVAVEVLAIDADELLGLPLLERRRLLESVLVEGDLVRIGVFIRPPVDTWLGSWRSLGFHSLAYKAANSRYQPGQRNDDWAIARIPAR